MKTTTINKVKVISIWVLVAFYLVIVLGLVGDKSGKSICNNLTISVLDSADNSFVTKNDVSSVLHSNNLLILGQQINKINTKLIEETLESKALIKRAEVFKTTGGDVRIEVVQRQPILRLIDKYNRSFYMDSEGYILPASSKYTAYVLVANGKFTKPDDYHFVGQEYDKQDHANDVKVFQDLYQLAKYVNNSTLWDAQFEQLYVNTKLEFEFVPRVGSHIIFFGDATDIEKKFRKLYGLYIGGFNNVGWNKYDKINLKYNNQVICTKR